MENPLILPTSRQGLMQQMGREQRKANRQKEDDRILRTAMSVFRLHLPEMMVLPPDASQFEKKWPEIDKQLRKDLKSEVAYRRAYSFICKQIEVGNRHGIWKVTTPHTYITLRRNRPLRNLSWQQRSILIANAEQQWISRLDEPSTNPDTLFTYFLLSCILYGGLNRPELWPALGVALTVERPLNGDPNCCWLVLKPAPSGNIASNLYLKNDDQVERLPIAEVHYFPDPISLGLLQQFLHYKTVDWQAPTSIAKLFEWVQPELSITCSSKDLSQGGISVAEAQTGIVLPQVLVEFALGRQPSASLPNCYWKRLLNPGLFQCGNYLFSRFHPLAFIQNHKAAKPKKRQPRGPVFFKIVVTLCLNIKLHLLRLLLVLYLGLGSRLQPPHNFSRL